MNHCPSPDETRGCRLPLGPNRGLSRSLGHRARHLSAALLTALAAAAGASAALAAEPGPRHRPAGVVPPAANAAVESADVARVIVKYRSDSSLRRVLSTTARNGEGLAAARRQPLHASALSVRLGVPLKDGRVLGSHTQSLTATGIRGSELVRRLQAQGDVEWAVLDERRRVQAFPNDPLFPERASGATPLAGQWYLRAPTTDVVSAINATGAWDISTGSASITVAVLDTGVRADHPDLSGKLWPGYDFVALDRGGVATTANDGDGRDGDPSDPGDWTNANECGAGEPASLSSWHGTQVAGLIGASTNNGLGMAGLGWQTMVLPVRVLGRCGGFDSDIIAGMRWAAGLTQNVGVGLVVNVPNPAPARVLNLSLGSQGICSAAYQEVFNELGAAGVVTVVAAGNDTGLKVSSPANCDGAIAVSGVRHIGSKVGYSNLGPEVALAAPAGNCVNTSGPCLYPLLTTVNLGARTPGANGYSDSSEYTVGTSFAAPLVAGTAALMLAVDPTLNTARVRELLQAATRPFPSSRPLAPGEDPVPACRAPDGVDQLECFCTSRTCGAGMLDAAAALSRTLAQRPTPVVSEPVVVTSTAGGSGGGASGLWWLLGLCCGTGALWAARRSNARGR